MMLNYCRKPSLSEVGPLELGDHPSEVSGGGMNGRLAIAVASSPCSAQE